jgi:hypothetical protein
LEGPFGRAWPKEFAQTDPAYATAVGAWVVEAPGVHPAWSQYALAMLHLRDLPVARRPVKYHPKATHEIQVFALDPRVPLAPERPEERPVVLMPQHFVGQCNLADDDAMAERMLRGIVGSIVRGQISPDTAHRPVWQRLFRYNRYRLSSGDPFEPDSLIRMALRRTFRRFAGPSGYVIHPASEAA